MSCLHIQDLTPEAPQDLTPEARDPGGSEAPDPGGSRRLWKGDSKELGSLRVALMGAALRACTGQADASGVKSCLHIQDLTPEAHDPGGTFKT
jgi:hypothetical protein